MKKKILTALSIALFLFCLASTSSALQYSQSIEFENEYLDSLGDGKNVYFNFQNLPIYPISNMTVEFWVLSDLSYPSLEYIDVTVDGNGYDFGTWFNGVLDDDTIDGPPDDIGNDCGSIFYGTSTIPMSELSNLLADGNLIFLWDFNYECNTFCDNDYVKTKITYDYALPPDPPLATVDKSEIYVGQSAMLAATDVGLNQTVTWYQGLCDQGVELGSGLTIEVSPPIGMTTYYAVVTDTETSLVSACSNEVTVTVSDMPIPTLSQWGSAAFMFLLAAGAILALRRKRGQA